MLRAIRYKLFSCPFAICRHFHMFYYFVIQSVYSVMMVYTCLSNHRHACVDHSLFVYVYVYNKNDHKTIAVDYCQRIQNWTNLMWILEQTQFTEKRITKTHNWRRHTQINLGMMERNGWLCTHCNTQIPCSWQNSWQTENIPEKEQ